MSILEPALAQKFIDKTAKHLEYNINIMNDKGIIIASKDATRVGNFHEVAFRMLEGTRDSGVVKEDQLYLGTKPGVNLFIDYKNRHVGVICVTGNPENVHSFANLVKTSMEAMLEYEIQMQNERKMKDKTEQFLYYLLFDEASDEGIAANMAEKLDVDQAMTRVCMVIKWDPALKSHRILDGLLKAQGHSHHDLLTTARNEDIILLKSLGADPGEAIRDYKEKIEGYVESFLSDLPEGCSRENFRFYVGSLQNRFLHYRKSFLHAQELSLQVKEKQGICYFNDHVLNYYRSLANIKAYNEVFNAYEGLLSEEEKKQMVEIVEALRNNNYNIVYSAKELFIHRNTMLFRLNKLKEILNLDPVQKAEDREFFNELAYYFKNKR